MTLAVDADALWSQTTPTPSTPRAALFVRAADGNVVAECRRAADAALIVDEHNAIVSGALTETAPLREALVSVATYRAEQDVAFDDADADWRLIAHKMESIARRALDAEADRGE